MLQPIRRTPSLSFLSLTSQPTRCPRCLLSPIPTRTSHLLPSTSPSITRRHKSTEHYRQKRQRAKQEARFNTPTQMSKKVQLGNVQNSSRTTDDLGLFPHTFIRPANDQLPGLFGHGWKLPLRVRLEWKWIMSRVKNFWSLLAFLKWSQRDIPKALRSPLDLRSRPAIALSLHRQFYTSLAAGDSTTLDLILCDGLASRIRSQLATREERSQRPQTWSLVRYTSGIRLPFTSRFLPWPLTSAIPGSQAKIMSDMTAPAPMGNRGFLRQCVVRIRSLQRLDRNDGQGVVEADVTEYLVMQQLRMDGAETRWKIWGTTQPSSREELRKMLDTTKKADKRLPAVNPVWKPAPTVR